MARQTTPHSSNFSFPVTLEPLTVEGHDSGFYGTVRRDEGFPRVLGVAGERYALLQNSDFSCEANDLFLHISQLSSSHNFLDVLLQLIL